MTRKRWVCIENRSFLCVLCSRFPPRGVISPFVSFTLPLHCFIYHLLSLLFPFSPLAGDLPRVQASMGNRQPQQTLTGQWSDKCSFQVGSVLAIEASIFPVAMPSLRFYPRIALSRCSPVATDSVYVSMNFGFTSLTHVSPTLPLLSTPSHPIASALHPLFALSLSGTGFILS